MLAFADETPRPKSRRNAPKTDQNHRADAACAKQQRLRAAIGRMVTDVFGVDERAIVRTTRGRRPIAEARQVAMYVAHVNCGLSLTEVGRLFRRDRTTVAHACLLVEMRRDEVVFDRALDLIGWAAPAMIYRADDVLVSS